ncbi:MAG: aminotransferase class I/II-fold pyridoxal phosphate-dependent enzyme [Chloroflexi bacterium]|nr:aminotransferase class I/II-fold pyridoxal phosphate-dependent enzyme [Chloroflexota bacterium]
MAKRSDRVAGFGTTIFTEINQLAQQHNALNLGQGKPDFDGPGEIIQAAVTALQDGSHNQYAPGPGAGPLRQAVADHAKRFYKLEIDPQDGVIVTAGATEAIFSSVLGLVDRGDEVIVIEPYFDSYVPNITMAGATPVFVPLHPPTWTFDPDELRAAFGPRTRALILNTPHNPTGRVFTREELMLIAGLCQEHDVSVISDEVYEHLIFDGVCHIPIATLPGMFERTVTISSLGKSFSVTGWKIGWVSGAPELVRGVAQAHQFVTFAVNYPAQQAAAFALNLPETYFSDFRKMYTGKRDLLLDALKRGGLEATRPQGTYFVMADFSSVFDGDDIEFARYLTSEIGVACIPPTFFYSHDHAHMASTQARFAFCKSDEMLKEVGERLAFLGR